MTEYGLIDKDGIMTSKILEPYNEHFKDEDGELKERSVTIDEQAEKLISLGWKPVDLIDESSMIAEDYFSISIIPFDNGNRISYKYIKIFDLKAVSLEIKKLKNKLTSTESDIGDYKITKCYEASLAGKQMPYDIELLSEKRQKVRDEINELEELILNNK